MLTQMTLRSTGFVDPQILPSCVRTCLHQGRSQEFDLGVYVLTSHCNFKTYVNVPYVNKTLTDFGGIYTNISPVATPPWSACIDKVSTRMASNRLQLNQAKTEVLWCSSSCRQHQISPDSIRIGSTDVQPVTSIRDFGVYIDADMTERTHVTAVIVRACFAALHQIRSVRRSLSPHVLLTFVRALIVSKVDYCNSFLAVYCASCKTGCSPYSVIPPRLVFSARRSERTTPLLRELHWLRVPERVTFRVRLCVLA